MSYWYAKSIIGGRWPEGEEAIIKSKRWAEHYWDFVHAGK